MGCGGAGSVRSILGTSGTLSDEMAFYSAIATGSFLVPTLLFRGEKLSVVSKLIGVQIRRGSQLG